MSTIDEIWQIELRNIVSDNKIRVYLCYEVSPFDKEIRFILKLNDVGTHDMGASVEGEDIPYEGLAFTLSEEEIQSVPLNKEQLSDLFYLDE